VSQLATQMSQAVLKQPLSDPMSGFFALRREVIEGSVRGLSAIGFKILVDLVANSPVQLRVAAQPYTFRTRHGGQSKLDGMVAWEFAMQLAALVGVVIGALWNFVATSFYTWGRPKS
jgi:dolichol-phosphate mannosyltransferase